MNKIDANFLLQEMHSLAQISQNKNIKAEFSKGLVEKQSFQGALTGAINKVNDLQLESSDLAKRYDSEDPSVSLPDVMISMQKSNVSFQALTQVRNRFVSAYQDIMNMQV